MVAFEISDEACPYDDFREGVRRSGDKKAFRIIDAVVTKLKEVGLDLLDTNMMDNIGEGIYELRPGDYRVFCFFDRPRGRFVLLHGFRKTTRKTPEGQKSRARELATAYKLLRRP